MTTPLVLSVSQLNRQIKSWLEHEIGAVSVEGELSNVSKPSSGHYYFTLKDAQAQIRCVYFKNRHTQNTSQILQNGQQVLANGRLSVYEARGEYQLIVEELSDSGLGELYRTFELLKTKLKAEGLFESTRKKPLPKFPTSIGVITSPTGAALQDILTTLARRYPKAHIYIYASEVQGKGAPLQLIQAIEYANQQKLCDVLLLARGGGSIEDLWAFNDEALAYAICKSQIPIVSGVGHETDFTIADFVADLRAATPTAAAESITPDVKELLNQLYTIQQRLLRAINQCIQQKNTQLLHHIQKMTSPKQLIRTHWQTLDYLEQRLNQALSIAFTHKQQRLSLLSARLAAKNPDALIQQASIKLQTLESQLIQLIKIRLDALTHKFRAKLATLHAVSPLATLDRGYAIALHKTHVLINSQMVDIGDTINVRLAKGTLICELISKES